MPHSAERAVTNVHSAAPSPAVTVSAPAAQPRDPSEGEGSGERGACPHSLRREERRASSLGRGERASKREREREEGREVKRGVSTERRGKGSEREGREDRSERMEHQQQPSEAR